MSGEGQILERGDGMVLAAHRTPVGGGLVAVTVETVTFDPPERIGFRLVRGPCRTSPRPSSSRRPPSGTRLTYTGELGTDLGALGERWGDLVARSWVATVRGSLETIRVESERRSAGKPTPRR